MQPNSLSLVYRTGQAPREIPLAQVSDFIGDTDNFIWLDIQSPGGGLLATLGEELDLHELSLEDALTTHQRPKLDEYGDYLFISSKAVALTDGQTLPGELHLFIGLNFIVVIRHGPCLDFTRARDRLSRRHNGFRPERSAALYFILDEIVDQYQPVIAVLSDRFRGLEARLLSGGLAQQDLEKLYKVKHELNALRDVIDPLQGVVLDLIRVHPEIVSKELKVYYRDVHDHALRAVGTIDLLRGAAFDAMQFHMATLTLRQNEAVQKLAGWGAILAIPTVIFSLYGMNFKSMPELGWVWAYPVVVLGTVAGAFWLYRRFKKRGWI
ncbi:MAG: magnesium and cobalt transport protein CorA [Hydrogenophilales bacterium]|nr:magnesium and cobalt transport protein CorA [Hydrogenophilales bacterium]